MQAGGAAGATAHAGAAVAASEEQSQQSTPGPSQPGQDGQASQPKARASARATPAAGSKTACSGSFAAHLNQQRAKLDSWSNGLLLVGAEGVVGASGKPGQARLGGAGQFSPAHAVQSSRVH